MTVTPLRPAPRPALRPLSEISRAPARSLGAAAADRLSGVRAWVLARRADLIVLGMTLLVVGPVAGWNMRYYPEMANDDEGTYADQAWAVVHLHKLAHYTYWYDHPPVGWIQIAFYGWITHGFARELWVDMGREYMLICKVVSCILLFVICRRLGYHRITGAVAAVVFALNPFSLFIGREVFLDNIAVPWTLAAMVFALSPSRRLVAAIASATCFAVAVLSKETVLVLLPGVVWTLIRNSDRRNRSLVLACFAVVIALDVAVYPLYAAVKNELLEGPGHVSLQWAVEWQLFFRNEGTGSLLVKDRNAINGFLGWYHVSPWFFAAGVALIPLGFVIRALRPTALMLAIGAFVLLRGGYLPAAYAVAYLPFLALVIAGSAEWLWQLARRSPYLRRPAVGTVGAALLAALVLVTPGWARAVEPMLTVNDESANLESLAWIDANVPRTDRIMCNDDTWGDLVQRGFNPQKVVWYYKVNTDPAVERTFHGKGWKAFDYLVDRDHYLEGFTLNSTQPTVYYAFIHSHVVATFRSPGTSTIIQILKVDKDGRREESAATAARAQAVARARAVARAQAVARVSAAARARAARLDVLQLEHGPLENPPRVWGPQAAQPARPSQRRVPPEPTPLLTPTRPVRLPPLP